MQNTRPHHRPYQGPPFVALLFQAAVRFILWMAFRIWQAGRRGCAAIAAAADRTPELGAGVAADRFDPADDTEEWILDGALHGGDMTFGEFILWREQRRKDEAEAKRSIFTREFERAAIAHALEIKRKAQWETGRLRASANVLIKNPLPPIAGFSWTLDAGTQRRGLCCDVCKAHLAFSGHSFHEDRAVFVRLCLDAASMFVDQHRAEHIGTNAGPFQVQVRDWVWAAS